MRPRLVWALAAGVLVVSCAPAAPASPMSAPRQAPSASASDARAPSPSLQPVTVAARDPWIVYQGGASGPARIRLVRPDGTGDHPVAPDVGAGEQQHPDWTHDGQRLVFSAEDSDGTKDLWVVGADGSAPARIYDCVAPCVWADDPSWSPHDDQVVFQQGTAVGASGEGAGTLEVLDVPAGKAHRLWIGDPTEWPQVPRWSPDGATVVFWLQRFASARLDDETAIDGTIGVASVGTSPAPFRSLLPWGSHAWYPDWSATTNEIVYVGPATKPDDGTHGDVFIISADGRTVRRLTTSRPTDDRPIQPSWTPDGDGVIYALQPLTDGVRPRVAIVGAAGGDARTIDADGFSRTHPRLRPAP